MREALGLRPKDSNPCRRLRRRKTGFEAHYLTDDEFATLGQALDVAEADHPVALAALRFLLYTGARKSEALRLRLEHVHGDRAVLPDSKTGPRAIWLASHTRVVAFHFISARFSQIIPYAFLAMLRNCRMVVSRARGRVKAQGFATVPGTRTIGIVRTAFYWRTAYWKDALPGEEA